MSNYSSKRKGKEDGAEATSEEMGRNIVRTQDITNPKNQQTQGIPRKSYVGRQVGR